MSYLDRALKRIGRTAGRLGRTLRLRRGFAGLLVVGLAVAVLPAGPAAASSSRTEGACRWRVALMPTPRGTTGGDVRGSDGGDRWVGIVAGGAALWRGGRLTVLGPGRAADVNRHGVVVGSDEVQFGSGHAVMWVGGRRIRLAEPAGVAISGASAVNDAGLIVGSATYRSLYGDLATVGLVWSVRSPRRVKVLTYRADDVGLSDVSATGLIVGIAWQRGSEMDHTVAVQGTARSGLRAMVAARVPASGAGSVSGRYVVGSTPAGATVWRAGTTRILAVRRGMLATGVNRSGLVSGFDTTTYRPLAWRGNTVWRLPLPRGWSTASPMTVNDAGQIAGDLTSSGEGRPVIWTCR